MKGMLYNILDPSSGTRYFELTNGRHSDSRSLTVNGPSDWLGGPDARTGGTGMRRGTDPRELFMFSIREQGLTVRVESQSLRKKVRPRPLRNVGGGNVFDDQSPQGVYSSQGAV